MHLLFLGKTKWQISFEIASFPPGLILGSQAVEDVIVLRCFFLENFDVA